MYRDLVNRYRRCKEFVHRPRSFRVFLAAAALLVLIPIHAAIIIVMVNIQATQRHRIVSNVRYVAELTRAAFDTDVMHWRADLRSLAAMVAAAPDKAARILGAYHQDHPEIVSLAVIVPDGNIITQTGRSIARETAGRLHAIAFAPATAHQGMSVRPTDPADGDDVPLIGLTATPGAIDEAPVAIAALVRLREADALLPTLAAHPAWRLAIADLDGRVLAASDRTLIGQSVILPSSPPALVDADSPMHRVRRGDVEEYLSVVAALSGPWQVVASIPVAELDPSLRTELNWVFLAGVLLVLPLAVNLLLGHNLGRRLVVLADAARAVSHERAPGPMRPSPIREINAVQRTLRIASALMQERAQARARVRDMREVLERAQRMESIGQAMAGVAHDFGNLVFVIGGNLEQLRSMIGDQGPKRDMIDTMLRVTQEARWLITLLSYGGQRDWREPAELDVNASIAELSELLRDVIGGGAARLVIRIDPDLMHCYLDPILFKSVLCNLVINARNAMPRGGDILIAGRNVLLDETDATAKGLAPGAYVTISVSDTGVGIAAELRARIFDPFVTTQTHTKGAGLGLSILYGFVKTPGGQVEVSSEPNRGATFTLYFPAIEGRIKEAAALEMHAESIGGLDT